MRTGPHANATFRCQSLSMTSPGGRTPGGDSFESFHTYGVWVEPGQWIAWYLDDVLVLNVTQDALGPGQSPGPSTGPGTTPII